MELQEIYFQKSGDVRKVILETSEERVKLIKAGYSQKEIEEIYLTSQAAEVALTMAYSNRSRVLE